MRVVFLGSAEFGIPAFQKILEHHDLRAVVTTPPKPQGRGLKLVESPIASFARLKGVERIFDPQDLKSRELFLALSGLDADIFVVVAFRILPQSLFSIPRFGTVNIHASLLPRFRGPAPIQRAIETGEKETGITIFQLNDGVDTGEVLVQRKVAIGAQETTPELYERLSLIGADSLIEALEGTVSGSLAPVVQNEHRATRAPRLKKEEALIDWKLSAQTIFNKIRAFKPFPGTYTFLDKKRLHITWAEPVESNLQGDPGTVTSISSAFFEVSCGQGNLRVLDVKPEGRKEMSVHDFILGTRIMKGTRFCGCT